MSSWEGESGGSVSLLSRTPKARALRQFLESENRRFLSGFDSGDVG